MDKIKKLSQAIRLGATFRPQCTGEFSDSVGTCALGAAMEAVGLEPKMCYYKELRRRFPVLGNSYWSFTLAGKITRLNDNGQTREQIADWLEAQGL